MPGSFSIIYLPIWVWRSVVTCAGMILLSLNICNVLINSLFSIWLELSTSGAWIRYKAAILPVSLSINEYLQYFALCLGSHIDYLPWANSHSFFSLSSKSYLRVEYNFDLLFLQKIFFQFYSNLFSKSTECSPTGKKLAILW